VDIPNKNVGFMIASDKEAFVSFGFWKKGSS
jgi:hypothetical protein